MEKPKLYIIHAHWMQTGTYEIEATSLEEAREKARDMDYLPNSENDEGSFEIGSLEECECYNQ